MTPKDPARPTGPVPDGELVLTARIESASNAVFLGTIGDTQVVYKPEAGERPLWDFPDGTLAQREVAAYLVSEVFGGGIVPTTWLREGPAGPGMVQRWCEVDPEQTAVDVVPLDQVPASGWRHVFDGADERDREVSLLHEDGEALRRMALFDVVANNADRKAGHILAVAGGHRHGIDHGLTFHAEHKLRTVLWGWIDEPLQPHELAAVTRVQDALGGRLGTALSTLLTEIEVAALDERCSALLASGRFPAPAGHMPAVPWPIF